MAKKIRKGLFITFEGPEGSGKSTHSRRLYNDLVTDGYDAAYTMEPGGTALGNWVRKLLLEKDSIRLKKKAELFLFEADRAQHVEELIEPLLIEGKIVLCDRFNASTFAYQGYGLGLDKDLIKKIDDAATGGLCPDLTILLDVDIKTGLERAGTGGPADRMEKRPGQFHEKVRQGYLALAKESPERIKVIRVMEKIDKTYDLVKGEVYDFITRCQGTG